MQPLFTIGYEATTLETIVARLKASAVDVVIDVRAVAASRRAGFSKTVLAASLAEAGVDYVHLRDLGTPKPGRDAARKGRIAEMTAIFNDHLAEPAAQAQLAQASKIVAERRAALLCFEADHLGCHRKILADLISSDLGCEIVNL